MEKEKMRIFWLVNKADGMVEAVFNVDTVEHTGVCKRGRAWEIDHPVPFEWELVAEIYFRFDGCTHWHFWGEDWEGTEETADSYYHICGSTCLLSMMRYMAFVWTVCGKLQNEWSREEFYLDDKRLNHLIESALEGYEIQERLGKNEKENDQ